MSLDPFEGYGRIVLVANSDAVDVATLETLDDGSTLFVFFNKTYKVLDRAFERPCLLLARSSPAGANIVYRREVEAVTRFLVGPRFKGIVNLKAGAAERFSEPSEFGGHAVTHLDLSKAFEGFYSPSHVPTSGFALALHLLDVASAPDVVLCGFTARRSARWKLFHDHDWTFEHIVLRLLARSGRLRMVQGGGGEEAGGNAPAILSRFPEMKAEEVALVSSEVLSERLEGATVAIDGLLKVTRPLTKLDGFVRGLRPATRKSKLAAKEKGGGAA